MPQDLYINPFAAWKDGARRPIAGDKQTWNSESSCLTQWDSNHWQPYHSLFINWTSNWNPCENIPDSLWVAARSNTEQWEIIKEVHSVALVKVPADLGRALWRSDVLPFKDRKLLWPQKASYFPILPTSHLGHGINLEGQMQGVNFTYHLPLPNCTISQDHFVRTQ